MRGFLKRGSLMALKMDDLKKVLKIMSRLEKKGKKDPADIDRMEGCFADFFPTNKSSVDIMREEREKMFKA
jgi:hypothetical protein